jgi:predicted amidophosphoribosyltransferase
MQAFKQLKLTLDETVVEDIVEDLIALVEPLFGAGMFETVVPVACGHSRRPNCLSAVLASALSSRLGVPFQRAFRDRYVTGVSHPKEFSKLPPLRITAQPSGPCLVVDDVATSGFHMHEALATLREAGVPAMGVVWISGVRQS